MRCDGAGQGERFLTQAAENWDAAELASLNTSSEGTEADPCRGTSHLLVWPLLPLTPPVLQRALIAWMPKPPLEQHVTGEMTVSDTLNGPQTVSLRTDGNWVLIHPVRPAESIWRSLGKGGGQLAGCPWT